MIKLLHVKDVLLPSRVLLPAGTRVAREEILRQLPSMLVLLTAFLESLCSFKGMTVFDPPKPPERGSNCQAICPCLDLDGHSDPEESFAQDLPDFPSINPEVTGIDDEDDTSIGIPSLAFRAQGQEDLRLSYDKEELSSESLLGAAASAHNLTNDLAGFVTRGMIQLALSGSAPLGSASGSRQQHSARALLRTSSSELDTDAEGDDFELLDQSELNQVDPASSRSQSNN